MKSIVSYTLIFSAVIVILSAQPQSATSGPAGLGGVLNLLTGSMGSTNPMFGNFMDMMNNGINQLLGIVGLGQMSNGKAES